MTTQTLPPIESGRWTMALPNGMQAVLRIDAEAGQWGLDVWQGQELAGRAVTSTGTLESADWFALAVAFGAVPFPGS